MVLYLGDLEEEAVAEEHVFVVLIHAFQRVIRALYDSASSRRKNNTA
jgi:hypothetical protein